MHLFYPSHDIALANGVKHFNPPFAAQRLEEDLAPIADIWNNTHNLLPFTTYHTTTPLPWGWNYDTRALLNKAYGAKMKNLPSDDDLRLLRELSSRKTTIEILKKLKAAIPDAFEGISLPVFIENPDNLNLLTGEIHNFVLKSPWSCSGRGLARSDVWTKEALRKHAAATIKKQGGIIVEPWYENKTLDLAELFYIGKNSVKFVGYSIFHNDENGTYRYGELMSNQLMSCSLPQICDDTRDMLIPILTDLFQPFFGKTWEVGYIGIDMMLLNSHADKLTDSMPILHPCIEMNVRCTMGVVARLFFDQTFGVDSNEIGEFYITPASDFEKLKKMDNDFCELYKSRYHRLTKITPDTMFMAYAIMA